MDARRCISSQPVDVQKRGVRGKKTDFDTNIIGELYQAIMGY